MLFKVSVIIPTYKRGNQFLERAVRSVLQQTYANVEVVVVDDNPIDSVYRKETELLMAEFRNEPNVRYIKNANNLGGALSRNAGIEASTGEFVTFLDDDDRYLPEKIEKQLMFMLQHDLEMSFTDLRIHDTAEQLLDYRQFARIQDFNPEALFKYHLMYHITGTPTFMYQRQLLEAISGFDAVPMGQEFYLMLKTIRHRAKIGYLPECDVIAYIHDGEKISTGAGKLKGESDLFRFKKTQFVHFSKREQKYMTSRHHAVMALAARRTGRKILALKHLLFAVLSSPVDAFTEMFTYFNRLTTKKSFVNH
jgi:glycosyltransferase involved in cell wall biosynthesis